MLWGDCEYSSAHTSQPTCAPAGRRVDCAALAVEPQAQRALGGQRAARVQAGKAAAVLPRAPRAQTPRSDGPKGGGSSLSGAIGI